MSHIKRLDANARDFMRTYIDGKMKRYYLLFAVNGGEFGIAELMRDPQGTIDPLGQLTLPRLAFGAIIFTWLLWWDIWTFGEMMRERLPEPTGSRESTELHPESEGQAPESAQRLPVFTPVGKAILTLLTSLLTVAWFLAADDGAVVVWSVVALASLTITYRAYIGIERRRSRQSAA